MLQEREEQIRQRAHEIWEAEGRPEGRHEEHWARAEASLAEAERPQRARKPKAATAPRANAEAGEAAPRKRARAKAD